MGRDGSLRRIQALAESLGTIIVGRLVAGHRGQRWASLSREGKTVARGARDVIKPSVAGASGGTRPSRVPRSPKLVSPPNNGMHPTADTKVVMLRQGAPRRVMRGVRLLRRRTHNDGRSPMKEVKRHVSIHQL